MTISLKQIALATLIPVALGTQLNFAQDLNERSLYVIFDGSNSMWGELPDKTRKITVAKDVFNSLDASLFANREIALRLYGHRRADDCNDTELTVPFGPADENFMLLSAKVNSVTPRGKTPITRSLQAALSDFDDREGDILLISDGIETCDADPCELVQSWRDNKIKIRVHVVGLGLDDLARDAMQCIAEASGTQYLDANSSGELAGAIEQAASSQEPDSGAANPLPDQPGTEFKLSGIDQQGNYLPIIGTLTSMSGNRVEVKSNRRYVFDGGKYNLTAGVPTINGSIYQPVTKEIEIASTGGTRIQLAVPRPPQIITRFYEKGEEIRGVNADVFQNDKKQFSIRPNEDYFVLPGDYYISATLNKDNRLENNASISEGDYKIIEFNAVETVKVSFRVSAEGQDKPLRQHQQLLQDGVLKYKVHWSNGAQVIPGKYTLKSENPMTPYQIDDVTIVSGEEKQTFVHTVPYATIKPRYVFVNNVPSKDLRCWFERIDSNDVLVARSKARQCDGRDHPVLSGRYRVRTWDRLGEFTTTSFDAVTGQTTEVLIQEK